MELAPYILLSILTILISGRIFKTPYDRLRLLVIPLLGVVSSIQWVVTGASINLPDMVIWITLGMLGWWVLATLVSPYHHVSVSQLSLHVGSVMFAMCAFSDVNLTGVAIIMAGFVLNCLYAITQNMFKYEPLKHLANKGLYQPLGFIGNTNMLGNFLVVGFFLSLLLGAQSSWWFLVTCLITYVIFSTSCKASYIGLAVGGLFVVVMTDSDDVNTVLVLAGIFIMLMMTVTGVKELFSAYNKRTLSERFKYWRVAWEQIKAAPLFGIGLDALKCRVPYIQRELNIKSNGKFLDPKTYEVPYPQKCHNDYIQMMCDVGIPGVVCYVILIVMALLSNADPILKGGLIAMLVTGLFMHNLHLTPINVCIWFLLFGCLRDGGGYVVSWQIVSVIVAVILTSYVYVIREVMCEYYFCKGNITKNADLIAKGLKYCSTDGNVLVNLGGICQSKHDPVGAFMYTMKGIHSYDGAIRMWELYLNAAKSQLVMGGLVLSEALAKMGLEFLPSHNESKVFVKSINDMLLKGYQVKRHLETTNESKVNGT